MNTHDDAKLAAEIAKLQAAKGIQLGAWLRANTPLVAALAAYAGLLAVYAFLAKARGMDPMAGVVAGAVIGPVVLVSIALKWRARRRAWGA